MKVDVIDYGVGNLHSNLKAWRALGAEPRLVQDPDAVARAELLCLPGVGAFAPAAGRLRQTGLDQALVAALARGARLIGICLGFQLLAEGSAEGSEVPGLGLLPGRAERFAVAAPVPQVGWNEVAWTDAGPLPDGMAFYFVHSYYLPGSDDQGWGWATYSGQRFAAAYVSDQVWGAQFHPEKSGRVGLQFLQAFLEGGGR